MGSVGAGNIHSPGTPSQHDSPLDSMGTSASGGSPAHTAAQPVVAVASGIGDSAHGTSGYVGGGSSIQASALPATAAGASTGNRGASTLHHQVDFLRVYISGENANTVSARLRAAAEGAGGATEKTEANSNAGSFSEHHSQVHHMEDPKCHVYIRRALRLREQYMADAFQVFPEMTKRALHKNYRSSVRQEKGGKSLSLDILSRKITYFSITKQ